MDALISAENPAQAFLQRDDATSKLCRSELARVYNVQASLKAAKTVPLGPLDELHVSELFSFDQVWHQLETRNSNLLPYAARRIEALINAASGPADESAERPASVSGHPDEFDDPSSDENPQATEHGMQQNGLSDEAEDEEDSDVDDDENSDGGEHEQPRASAIRKSSKPSNSKRRVRFDLDTSGGPSTMLEERESAGPPRKRSGPGSLEDGFFSVADMEAFADDAEMLAHQGKLLASDDESDDAIPDRSRARIAARLGLDDDSAEEDDDDDVADNDIENDTADTRHKHKFLYADFFDPPGASEEADAVRAARTRALLLDDIDDGEVGDDDENGDGATPDEAREAESTGLQTNLQKSRARTRKTIEAIEEANVTKRPWMLRGEASASARPKDSLLQTELEHDIAVPPKNFVSSDANELLEDVIKQRITDGLFDDVVLALPEEYAAKKRGGEKELPEISQEKPKEGLGELYEREFTEEEERREKAAAASQTVQKDEEAPETAEQKEVDQLWGKLAKKLDALSSLHFQPTPQEEVEMTVNDNVKALSKEEAIPDAVSDGNLLAPKEVFTADKADAKGDREVTKDERRAKRRRNKSKGKKSKVASKTIENAKEQADPVLADKRRAENALARRGKKLKTVHVGTSITKTGVDASFARAAYKAKEFVSKPDEQGKKPMSASQLRL